MSEYEGKTHWRKRSNVDLMDILYYEATGELMTSEERTKMEEKLRNIAEKEQCD